MMVSPWATGGNAALTWYDQNADPKDPYWSLWIGTQLMGSCQGGSMAECRHKLEQNLQFLDQSSITATCMIRLHEKKPGRINNKSDYYLSFNFRPGSNGSQQIAGISIPGNEFPNNPGMQAIFNKLVAIESRQTAIEEQLKPDGEGEGTGVGAVTPQQALVQMMLSPDFIGAVVPRVMSLFDKILPPSPPSNDNQLSGIGNIPGTDPLDQHTKIQQAVQILAHHDELIGDDLMILAKIAQADPTKFQNLLLMLRMNG